MNLDKLKPLFEFFGEPMPEIQTLPFAEHRRLPKWMGLYAIFQEERCVYVGKGKIPDRFKHHHNKAYEIWETSKGTRNGTQDPLGWQELRQQEWFDPSKWTVEYFLEDDHVNRAAYEGSMMKLLKPFANDEACADRKQLLKNTESSIIKT